MCLKVHVSHLSLLKVGYLSVRYTKMLLQPRLFISFQCVYPCITYSDFGLASILPNMYIPVFVVSIMLMLVKCEIACSIGLFRVNCFKIL